MDEERPGIAALERQMLQKRIGEPLAAVQTLLQRDKVVWTSGFLATPSVSVQQTGTCSLKALRLSMTNRSCMACCPPTYRPCDGRLSHVTAAL